MLSNDSELRNLTGEPPGETMQIPRTTDSVLTHSGNPFTILMVHRVLPVLSGGRSDLNEPVPEPGPGGGGSARGGWVPRGPEPQKERKDRAAKKKTAPDLQRGSRYKPNLGVSWKIITWITL